MSDVTFAKGFSRRGAFLVLFCSCVLLLVESMAWVRTRWVEDESWLSAEAWSLVHEGRVRMPAFPFDRFHEVDVTEPVHHLSVAASFAALGTGVAQARLVSALSVVVVVVVIFALAFELAGPFCAALAALLAASDTFLVVAARTARPEAETTLLCWLAVLLVYRAARRDSWKYGLVAGIVAGLSILCHPIALPFVACLGVFLLLRYRWTPWKSGVVWAFAAGGVAVFAPYVAWCYSDAAHRASFLYSYFGKEGPRPSLYTRLLGEADRWSDFIGLGSQRVALPIRFPLRLHVALILAAAFIALFRLRRKIAIPLAVLFAANVLWWWYMPNKGPRYMAIAGPLFALALAFAVDAARTVRGRALAIAAAVLVLATQLGGSAYWDYKYRTADYPAVARELRRIIPPGASVYGVTTFWMALHDRPYYAYDRTPLDRAAAELRPRYMILYDRVMVGGSGHGQDEFAELRAQATAFVRERGTLAGRVSNPFYGNLEIYRISY